MEGLEDWREVCLVRDLTWRMGSRSRTVRHVGLAVHSAIACCTAIDAHCVLEAGEGAVGEVFKSDICVEVVSDCIVERGAGDLARCTK